MIPKSCLDKQGSGTIVGICDTGINIDLSYFEGKKVLFKDFGTSSPHHGTNMASTIFDISPKCEMIFAGGLLDSYGRMLRMLEWLSTFELDVLNLSLAIDEPDDEILKTLHKIQNRGTLIVCSYSNKRPFLCQKEFISAGKGGDFEAPEERISMSSTGYLSSMKGTSVSAAITSGLCSLMKAVFPDVNKKRFLEIVTPNDVPSYKNQRKQVNISL